jgi:predicted transcriptional regulator
MLTRKLEHELEMLERHLIVLKVVVREGPIGILKLAEEVGFPRHKVRYSLRVLEHEGLIVPSPNGAVTTRKAARAIEMFGSDIDKLCRRLERIRQKL